MFRLRDWMKMVKAGWYPSPNGGTDWWYWDGQIWTGARRPTWPDHDRAYAMAAAVRWETDRGAQVRWLGPYLVEIDRRSSGDRFGQSVFHFLFGHNLFGWLLERSVRGDSRFFMSINEMGEFGRSVY